MGRSDSEILSSGLPPVKFRYRTKDGQPIVVTVHPDPGEPPWKIEERAIYTRDKFCKRAGIDLADVTVDTPPG